jgi:hypothetical protein
MENVATSVRITGDASAVLADLSAKLGQPKAQIVERALRELEEKVFWSAVQSAFEGNASDDGDLARRKTEIELWQRAESEDFRDEQW